MRKAAGIRFPHGATSDMVLATLWRLHIHTGRPQPVSRADLVQAACLPATTVDDRLRVLVKQRKVLKLGRGLYTPIYQRGGEIFDRYWQQRPPPGWTPSSKEVLGKVGIEPQPPGTRRTTLFPECVVLTERWLSVADFRRSELRQQRLKGLGEYASDDLDDDAD